MNKLRIYDLELDHLDELEGPDLGAYESGLKSDRKRQRNGRRDISHSHSYKRPKPRQAYQPLELNDD